MATVVVTHSKISTKPPVTDPSIIGGPDWNGNHVVTGLENVPNVDTTNAANITSGTLPAARLPAPTASTLGGVEFIAAVAHNWINSISTAGVPALSQPAASDLSNGVTGSGAVALANSPSFTTPSLDSATASSLTASGQVTGSGFLATTTLFPQFLWNATGNSTDQKLWDGVVNGAFLQFRAINDAQSIFNPWMTVARGAGATVSSVSIPKLVTGAYTSIVAFGGVGDGVTANDTAFANAYAALSATGGSIYFPTGTYVFASAIAKTMPNAKFSITLMGDGSNASTLQWPNASGGITFTASNNNNTFHIRDLTLTTSQVGSGTALGFIGVGANSTQNFQSDIHNVQISGDDIGPSTPTLHYWSTGIDIHNWGSVDIANTNTWGPHQTAGSAGGGVGLIIEGDTGTTSYTTLVNVTRSSFNFHTNGVVLGNYWQGVTFDQCNFNGELGGAGILANGTSGVLALLTVTNSQFNYAGTQIALAGSILSPTFIGNTITTFTNSQVGIQATGGLGLIFIGNFLNITANNPTGTFGVVSSGADGLILGNIFSGLATPVALQAGSANYGVNLNRYRAGALAANNTNAGTGNTLGVISQ